MPLKLWSLESQLLLEIQTHLRTPLLDRFFCAITMLGNKGGLWALVAILLLLAPRTRCIGVQAVASLASSGLFCNIILKNWIGRTRPYEIIPELTVLVSPQSDFSFPSGHAASAFAVAVVLFVRLPKRYGIPALVLASLISFSRLYIGVHYPSDVLAGILLGTTLALLSCRIWEQIEQKRISRNT